MTFNNSRSGINNATEYVVSGLPWVSSSVVGVAPFRVQLPMVSSRLSFQVSAGSALRVGFTANGVNGSNFVLVTNATGWSDFNFRCKEFFIRSDSATSTCSMAICLTTIDQKSMPVLTGSAMYNSASVAFVYGYGVAGDPGAGSGLG